MERVAIMVIEGGLPPAAAECCAWGATRRQESLMQPAARESMARRAEG